MWVKSREDIHSHKVASKKVLVLTYNKEKRTYWDKVRKKCLYFGHLKMWILLRESIYICKKPATEHQEGQNNQLI